MNEDAIKAEDEKPKVPRRKDGTIAYQGKFGSKPGEYPVMCVGLSKLTNHANRRVGALPDWVTCLDRCDGEAVIPGKNAQAEDFEAQQKQHEDEFNELVEQFEEYNNLYQYFITNH